MTNHPQTTPEKREQAQTTANNFATNLGFDQQQQGTLSRALEMQFAQMEDEDPNSLIPCSCCGDLWPASDVDAWGLCPTYQKK